MGVVLKTEVSPTNSINYGSFLLLSIFNVWCVYYFHRLVLLKEEKLKFYLNQQPGLATFVHVFILLHVSTMLTVLTPLLLISLPMNTPVTVRQISLVSAVRTMISAQL